MMSMACVPVCRCSGKSPETHSYDFMNSPGRMWRSGLFFAEWRLFRVCPAAFF